MATHTLATSSDLTAVTYSQSPLVLVPTDLATISGSIKNDMNLAFPGVIPGAFVQEGFLFIPNRGGRLKVLPGDVVAVDNQGWPILISANSIANGNWTYT